MRQAPKPGTAKVFIVCTLGRCVQAVPGDVIQKKARRMAPNRYEDGPPGVFLAECAAVVLWLVSLIGRT